MSLRNMIDHHFYIADDKVIISLNVPFTNRLADTPLSFGLGMDEWLHTTKDHLCNELYIYL